MRAKDLLRRFVLAALVMGVGGSMAEHRLRADDAPDKGRAASAVEPSAKAQQMQDKLAERVAKLIKAADSQRVASTVSALKHRKGTLLELYLSLQLLDQLDSADNSKFVGFWLDDDRLAFRFFPQDGKPIEFHVCDAALSYLIRRSGGNLADYGFVELDDEYTRRMLALPEGTIASFANDEARQAARKKWLAAH